MEPVQVDDRLLLRLVYRHAKVSDLSHAPAQELEHTATTLAAMDASNVRLRQAKDEYRGQVPRPTQHRRLGPQRLVSFVCTCCTDSNDQASSAASLLALRGMRALACVNTFRSPNPVRSVEACSAGWPVRCFPAPAAHAVEPVRLGCRRTVWRRRPVPIHRGGHRHPAHQLLRSRRHRPRPRRRAAVERLPSGWQQPGAGFSPAASGSAGTGRRGWGSFGIRAASSRRLAVGGVGLGAG